MSPLLFAIARTMSLPLWKVVFLISMPRFEKKPCAIPMSSAKPFAIGSPFEVDRRELAVVLVGIACGRPDEGEQQDGRADERKDRRQPTNPGACHPMYLPDLVKVARTVGRPGTAGAIMEPRLSKY